ncbi:hypothetical protein O1L55_16460 [Streptomyces albulus]|nr:hypothetical protein [Streptomyces noursei]
MTPDTLGAVLADGKGTVQHDAAEAELLRALLKDSGVPVSSVRPVTGTLGPPARSPNWRWPRACSPPGSCRRSRT